MPKFIYKLVNSDQELVDGSTSALTRKMALKQLTGEGNTVLFVKRDPNSALSKRLNLPSFGMAPLERILFFRNLALMIGAGVSVVKALRGLVNQFKSAKVKQAINDIADNVENGEPLSKSLGDHVNYFQPYLVQLVRVGEESGQLTETLERVAHNLQRSYELRRKIISSITYPIVIIFVMIAVVIGMITFVLPKIADLYRELEAPLPIISSSLLTFGNFIRSQPFVILAIILALIALVLIIRRYRGGRLFLHRLILRIPVFGELTKEFNLARLFRSLQTLLSSGLSLVDSIKISRRTLKNEYFRKSLQEIHPILVHGGSLTETIQQYPEIFPDELQQIVRVGEQSGNIEKTFGHITRHYENTVDHKTQVMASILEPVLMAIIGLIVGGLALSIFVPIYQVSSII